MSDAITITGSVYTVVGTVTNVDNNQGIVDLHVILYDYDRRSQDDFLGIGVTDAEGRFVVSFNTSKFRSFRDYNPDLYFIVKDAGTVLLDTKKEGKIIENAKENTPPIKLQVSLANDKLRPLVNPKAVDGWVGGFEGENEDFAYPNPDLSSLEMKQNRTNIDKLTRQQKVLWPEFSWESKPGAKDPERCYQMFAPDISRLGYTDDGRVYSIICPQQGVYSKHFGSMNVEVTVTGNRKKHVRFIAEHFLKNKLKFPSSKENAITIKTHNPGHPDQPIFPLRRGSSTNFPIPDFAKHEGIAWTLGHLGVEMGDIVQTDSPIVNDFNQLVLDIFNMVGGNMLQKGNVLTWNVWFTAPELVDQEEWAKHTEVWRQSIDSDHGSPDGEGTDARFYDGTPFEPVKEVFIHESMKIAQFLANHLLA